MNETPITTSAAGHFPIDRDRRTMLATSSTTECTDARHVIHLILRYSFLES
jgi:hypothetical protein